MSFLELKHKAFPKLKCLIFNRWGELMYIIDDLLGSWDGTYKGL
jgi:hypothetical protein